MGSPEERVRENPLDILIETILSQNTNDRNRDMAYQRLKTRFPRWEDVLEAKTKALFQPSDRVDWLNRRQGASMKSFVGSRNGKGG